jgi:hypothetical protein
MIAYGLSILTSLAGLVFFIIVLIKQFQTAGPLHGIIGIVTCGLWTFIWGWINSTQLNLKKTMLIWSVLIVAGIGFSAVAGAAGFGALMSDPEMKAAFEAEMEKQRQHSEEAHEPQ